MNTNPKDAPVPSHHGCLLPAVARMSSVTQVTPAKKITFLKRGDPRFSGVRLAVHQRTFKSFGALMDELSQRVPLPFGVRCVTTPRGLHGVSALEQLEDGGCYLCSDKMPPRTASVSGSCEVPGTSSSYKAAKGPRRLLLVKNEDPRFQHTVALSHRNTRTLTAFLSKASALLHFPVKQVYTTSGEKVDSLKSLLHGPSVFVCAGHEPFRPLAMEGGRRTETSSEQTLKNKNGSWGPKAKRSVIHARTGSGSRPRWPFLLSENTGLSNPPETQPQAWLDKHPQDMSVPLDPMVAGDNVEKKVHMNEDGSLSVEMKVRFHFLGEDTLLWSRLTGRGGRESPVPGEGDPFNCTWEAPPGGASEPRAGRVVPLEAGCKKAGDRAQWQPGSGYDIWMNPLYTSQREGLVPSERSGLTQNSHSGVPWGQRDAGRKRSREDSVFLSRDRALEDSDPNSSCCSGFLEDSTGSCVLHPSQELVSPIGACDLSRAGEGPCPGEAGPGGRKALRPMTRGAAGSLYDSSVEACSHQGRRDRHEQLGQSSSCKTRTVTSCQKVNQGGGPTSPTGRRENLQAEGNGQNTWHILPRCGAGAGISLTPNNADSGGTGGDCFPLSSCHPDLGRRRQWDNRVGARSSPGTSSLSRGAQGGLLGQHHNLQDTHSPLASPAAGHMPGSPSPDGLKPQIYAYPSGARSQTSGELGPPSSASIHFQDLQGVNSGSLSNSNYSSHLYPSNSSSTESEGGHKSRICSPALTPSIISHSVHSQTGSLGNLSEPSRLLGSQGPSANLVCGKFCPTPPRARLHVVNPLSCSSEHNGDDPDTYRGSGGGHSRDTRCLCPPASDTGVTTGRIVKASGGCSPCQGPKQEDMSDMSLGTLPCASPGAMVREWLSHIPEEPLLVKAEMVDQTLGMIGVDSGSVQEDHAIKCSPVGLGKTTQVRQPSLEGVISEDQEPGAVLPMAGNAGLYSEGGPPPSGVANTPQEAGVGKEAAVGVEGLPPRVSAHAHIIKVLLDSKRGRPSSLPEVSGKQASKLSHSAQALVTCLANLHFFDQDPVCPANQVRFTDSAQYQELLGIFQTLWMGGTFGLGQPEWCEVPQGLRSHMETEDLTPTSSSGVDVGNGSGGSGESSGPLVPERIELPLKTPNLEPNSRTSENTKDPDNQQLYAPEDSPSSQMKTPISHEFRAEGGHVVGGDLDQKADTMPDVEVQLEKAKDGMEEKDSQGENVKGEESSEEGRDSGQELSRTDSQDREDTQGRVQEEEAGRGLASKVTPDPEVPLLLPAERRENCPEYPRSLSERHSNTSRSHSDPRIETDVDKLSGEWELGCKFPQAQLSPGTSEKGPWRPRRPSLDPDILWVSRMLRKMEKVFMAHLAESMAKMRARWDLQACELLDQMVSELQQDLGWRLQASTDQELRKIQSQVGARLKAREALRWEMSLQTEQHRHCLQGLHNLWGAPALSLDDGALGVRLGREIAGEEFCPCEACLRKKEIPVTRVPIDTMGTASAPITKAFDLQHILQKKGQPAEEGAAEGAPEWRRDREEALQRAEEDFIDQKRDKTEDLPIDSGPKEPEGEEKGLDEKQEEEEKSCVVQVSSEAEAPEGGNPSAGEQSDNAQTAKILEAEGKGLQGLGGSQGEEVGQGQGLEASRNSSPDPEGLLFSGPDGDSSQQRSSQKAGLPSSSSTTSLGNSSQISQKDSEPPSNET